MPEDQDVFQLREEERERKFEERQRVKSLSVEQKSTFTSRMGGTMAAALAEVSGGVSGGGSAHAGHGGGDGGPPGLDNRRRDKENMTDFIAKKREIFLVQMSLDTKRAEIRKLEERALQREEALAKSERMLEEDALRFDAFLKENDQKVQEAIKRAELEAKAKQEKVQEMKRLNANITTIRSELNKYDEQLEDCRKYKEFLDSLTPPEFFKEQVDRRHARRAARGAQRQAKRDAHAQLLRTAADLEVEIAVKEGLLAEASRRGRTAEEQARQELESARVAAIEARERIPIALPAPSPENDDSDEETPMYFERPSQLLDMFAQLEEQNLFLIQNGQETEEALEELKNKHRATRERMEAETAGLNSQIASLKHVIAAEEEKAAELSSRGAPKAASRLGSSGRASPSPNANPGGGGGGAGAMSSTAKPVGAVAAGSMIPLEKLSGKVSEVYNRCGFDFDPSISTIQMLTNIESKLEQYLAVVDEMPPALVEHAEKQREKERRAVAREEKVEQEKAVQAERAARSLERSQAPVHRKTGKAMMTRSVPPSRKKKEEVVKTNTEEEELKAFLGTNF